MDALDRLVAASEFARDDCLRRLEEANPGFGERLRLQALLGLGRPPRVVGSAAAEWSFVSRLHAAVSEVDHSWSRVLSVPLFVRDFPFRKGFVARSDYLQYHLENWLNELFIFQERFAALCKVVERAHWTNGDAALMQEYAAKARQMVADGLSTAREDRNAHVHSRRVVDPGIQMFRDTERVLANEDSAYARNSLDREFRDLRRFIARSLEDTNSALGVVVEDCAACLSVLLVNPDDTLRTPLSNNGFQTDGAPLT